MPFRVGLAVFIMGPQGLDEKRVSTLVMRDEELIGALADYAEQTRDIEDTVETLTVLEDEEDMESDDPLTRLDRGSPMEQALSSLLKALNPTLMANNPLGMGKRMGPQTLMNKASVGFFENAGGSSGRWGVERDRAAAVSGHRFSGSLCAARRQQPGVLCAASTDEVAEPAGVCLGAADHRCAAAVDRSYGDAEGAAGAKTTLAVKPAKAADWRYADRIDTWMLTPVAGGETLPVKVKQGLGRTLDMDLRGFPGGPGKYRLSGESDQGAGEYRHGARAAAIGRYEGGAA